MNTEAKSQVHEILLSRRHVIANDWYRAIAQTSFVPHSMAEVRQRLVQLTDQAMALLLTEPFERGQAEAIGASLASLHYLQPVVLGQTQEILARQLVEGLPAHQITALQPRLAELLGGVAAGFFQQARETILTEQEQIRSALITELRQGQEALRKAYDEVEDKVQERTAELCAVNESLRREITLRQQAEEALRESEEKYRHIVERANDGICIIQDTVLQYANPRLAEMWGGTVEEIIDTLFTDYVHPDELSKVLDRYQRRMAGEDVIPIYETVLRRKDGGKVYVELNAGVVTYQGKPADLVIVRDITERKQAEEEIRQRNRELSILNAIAATVSQSLDLEEVLNQALTKVLEAMEMEVGAIRLLDEERNTLDLQVHRGVDLSPEIVESISRLKLAETLLARAVATGEPLIIEDISTHPMVELIGRRDLKSLAVIPLRSRGRVLGTMEVVSLHPRQFTSEEEELLTSIGNQIGVAIHNAQLWHETKRRLQESTILLEVSQALVSILELEKLLQLIVDSALEAIAPAESGVIHLLDDATKKLYPKALAGWPSGVIGKERMCIGEGIAGCALEQGEVINVPEVNVDPRFIKLESTHQLKSLLVAPLVADGKTIGTISLNSGEIGAFTTDDERLLMTLASYAATAVKNAQLFARSEELAAVKERHRIAGEIHDGLAQNLASLSMKIDYCLGLIDRDPQATKAVLLEAKAFVQENIREIRRSIFALHPPALKELGFLAALRKYAQEFQEQNALPVHLSIVGEEVQSQLPLRYEYELFRIVQEALNNVRRHARAKNVWITLDLSALDAVSLTVMDDGLGFDGEKQEMAGPALVGGFGLESMRERAGALRGRLLVETEPGSGTKITAILPLGRGG
ncbi:MAG: GAF domain-containing protein [Chloroflexi bacterium]|nr:GAF domain-containing protein [Chloroflexota bacterium]